MVRRYGEAFTTLPLKRVGPGSPFMEQFEIVKRDFHGRNANQVFELPLKMRLLNEDAGAEGYDFEEDQVLITR